MLQTRNSARTPLLTALLEGPAGSGKTAIAATLGIDSQFPFVKVLSAENMVGWGEAAKAGQIAKVFEDSYKVRPCCVAGGGACVATCDLPRGLKLAPVKATCYQGILRSAFPLWQHAGTGAVL